VISSKKQADEFAPVSEQYKKLQSFIPKYFSLQKLNWDSIAKPDKALHVGDEYKIVFKIKDRLSKLGDLEHNDSTKIFDTALLRAIKKFQRRMGLALME
jgi:murein L,D-transpeptidase YcbB/YkuD